jgi:hypothetical protein
VLSKGDVRRALRSLPGTRSLAVREIAWLDAATMAAIVRRRFVAEGFRGRNDLIAVFEGRRLVTQPEFSNPPPGLSRLTVDRSGGAVFALVGPTRGFFRFDRNGRFDGVLSGPEAWSLAPSPAGGWAAASGSGGVWILRSGDPLGERFSLPIEAHSLAWVDP